jgi:hypothetical protein
VVGAHEANGRRLPGQFNEALKEAELDGIQKDLQALSKIDPIGRVRKDWPRSRRACARICRRRQFLGAGAAARHRPDRPRSAGRAQGRPVSDKPEDEVEASRAPLLTHLLELRSRLIRAILAILVAFVLCLPSPSRSTTCC